MGMLGLLSLISNPHPRCCVLNCYCHQHHQINTLENVLLFPEVGTGCGQTLCDVLATVHVCQQCIVRGWGLDQRTNKDQKKIKGTTSFDGNPGHLSNVACRKFHAKMLAGFQSPSLFYQMYQQSRRSKPIVSRLSLPRCSVISPYCTLPGDRPRCSVICPYCTLPAWGQATMFCNQSILHITWGQATMFCNQSILHITCMGTGHDVL